MTPKSVTLNDFEWLEGPFYVICSLLRTATGSLFVAYLVWFVYYTCDQRVTSEVREAEYSKQ